MHVKPRVDARVDQNESGLENWRSNKGNTKHDATKQVNYDEVVIWSSEYMISQSLAQVT